MARYAEDSIRAVKDAVDMVDLVGSRTSLRRVNPDSYTGLCPFHQERTPSFSIKPSEKVYFCFGCQASGDAISFAMETESLDFIGAVEYLGDRYGVTLEPAAEAPELVERGDRLPEPVRGEVVEVVDRERQVAARPEPREPDGGPELARQGVEVVPVDPDGLERPGPGPATTMANTERSIALPNDITLPAPGFRAPRPGRRSGGGCGAPRACAWPARRCARSGPARPSPPRGCAASRGRR